MAPRMPKQSQEPLKQQPGIPLPIDPEGVLFPNLWIGTWSMGGEGFGPHDLGLSLRTLETAYEQGVRHFDTAGFYAQGRSEVLLAKAFGRVRPKVFISTKGGLERVGRKVWHDARPEALRQALFQSLDRLKTDYVDLFQLHWPDPETPLDESISALKALKQEGLIRYWGVGNLSAHEVLGYIGPGEMAPHQVHFNPIYRSSFQVLQAGRRDFRCLNCIVSPLEQGLLASGIYLSKELGKKDIRRRNPCFHDKGIRKWLEGLFHRCSLRGLSPVTVVLSWILSHKEVDVVIPGPRKPDQLDEITSCFGRSYDSVELSDLFHDNG